MTSEPQWPCNITSSLALPPPFFNIYTLVHPSICLCTAATPRNTPFPPPYSHTLSLLLPDNRHTDQTPSYCKQHHCWECSFCCCPRPPPPVIASLCVCVNPVCLWSLFPMPRLNKTVLRWLLYTPDCSTAVVKKKKGQRWLSCSAAFLCVCVWGRTGNGDRRLWDHVWKWGLLPSRVSKQVFEQE